MCRLKSCLVLKDRVFCPDYNSHQQMLEELGIEDDYLHASKTFVRVELTPPDGVKSLMEPLDRWTLKVDQDITPEWWNVDADRPRVEEAVEAWRKEHVFTEGEHSISTGIVYALSSATVIAYFSAMVEACDSAMVTAFDSATITAFDNAKVKACGRATVESYDNSTVEALDRATVTAYGSATITAFDRVTITAYNSATVEAYGNAMVTAFDSATVKAFDRATITAFDSATVEAYNHSIVVYPPKNKIVYPARWTAETHE